jgi:HprK-related kinase B
MSRVGELVEHVDTPFAVHLRFAGVPIVATTNDADVAQRLVRYYAPWVVPETDPIARVRLIQGPVDVDGDFADLERAGGKPVKEAVRDVEGGRLIRKSTTGIVMGLWPGHAFATGDVRRHLNQGINLINNCYAKAVLARGHRLLHASAVAVAGRAVVLAGPPGAGKSTSALHLVEQGFRLVSNDRVLARPAGDGVEIYGYPKQPRVNPGTLLHHPRLVSLVPPADRAELTALAPDRLWELERKSDVDVDEIYGRGTFELTSRMIALVLLRWRPRHDDAYRARPLRIGEALTAIPLLHKDLGAFDLDMPVLTARPRPDLRAYAELFSRVRVVEVRGTVDHPALLDTVREVLG